MTEHFEGKINKKINKKKCSGSIFLLLHYTTTKRYSQFNSASHIRYLNSNPSPATVMLTVASK